MIKKTGSIVLDILKVYGYEAPAFRTTEKPNSVRDGAHRAANAGFDLVIAAVGDGTINEVVSGIAPLEKRTTIAIIPKGTTNDFARPEKIPRSNHVTPADLI
ncbi:diacylglycerol kinase family protein [Streptococcus pluranimalium]